VPIRDRVDGISLFPALHKASGYGKVPGEDSPIHSLSYDSLQELRRSYCKKKRNEKGNKCGKDVEIAREARIRH